MRDQPPSILDSLPPDKPGADLEKAPHMDSFKEDARRRLTFTNGNMPLARRVRRPGHYAGYAVNRSGQVIVEMARILGNKEALKVARRVQEIGRTTVPNSDD